MKIDRLLGIVVVLLGKKKVTAKELAELFEVSERTIYRDIDTINLAGIPVVTQQGSGGGISIMSGFTMDRQTVSIDELSSMVTALQIAQGFASDKQYVQMRNKIESLVPDRHRQRLRQMQQSVAVDVVPWGQGSEFKTRWIDIQNAIARRQLLSFIYMSGKGETLRRICEPYKLIFKGRTWYLYAYCRLRRAFRLFRLSRVREFQVSAEIFAPRDITGYEEQINKDWSEASTPSIDLVLRFAPPARVWIEDAFGDSSIECHEDESFTVRLKFPEDEWVYSFVLSFGDLVEVVEPSHVREIIRRKARALLDRHS